MAVTVFDDRKREHTFFAAPKRIISLVPSDTYNVAALGAGAAIIGRTDYCELPADLVKDIPALGGTKNPRVDDIIALQPDLVLANQEENTRGDLEKLITAGLRVYLCFPKRVEDGLAHLAKLAKILHATTKPEVRALFKDGYAALQSAPTSPPLRIFCPIWMDPLMTIHESTFISDMIRAAGGVNVFADRERRYPLAADLGRRVALTGETVIGLDVRYPRITLDEVVERKPDVILLPNEPHPFTEADAEVFRALDTPAKSRIVFTDGKDLCWYGARSVEGLPRLRALVGSLR
ncbi:MAG: ABC transporter substrate-binding protein [Polyangiaceae bacterium]|nr:ABC transporter substrate-binding protein [Polyangiaceae bacterium]